MNMQHPTLASSSITSRIFLLKFCEHENAQSQIMRLVSENLTAYEKEITQGGNKPAFQKEDLFAPLPDGSMIFESPNFWNSFDRVVERLKQNNQIIGMKDFIRPGAQPRGKTMLQEASRLGKLDKIFATPVWDGRHNEAYELWFQIDEKLRSQVNILPVRRAIAATHGEKLREDRLAECAVTLEDIHNAVRSGALEIVNNRLQTFGEQIRKSDILSPRKDGDTVFYFEDSWKNFDKTVAVLQKNGEVFETGDFLLKRLNHQSLLQRAIEAKHLDKVFLPQIWVGRIDEMDRLWQQFVPEDAKNANTYPKWRQAALEAHYSKIFKITPDLRAADLLRPCDSRPDALTPLMLKTVWQDMATIRRNMAEKNEQLTTTHLRSTTPDGQSTYLNIALKNGALDEVLDIARRSKQPLTAADFLEPGRGGMTGFDFLFTQGKIPDLIKAELWIDRPQDLITLWQAIPAGNGFKASLQGEISRVNVLAMRQKMAANRGSTTLSF